jgi:integral membrane protein (TIGR01906 family)
MKKPPHPFAWLVTLALPVLLGFMNIRLLISPAFLRWEYNKPNFPPDRYGFTQAERLELAPVAVEFLASPESPEDAIRLLQEQTFGGEPLYGQRELDHMVDVKRRTDIMFRMMWAAGAIAVLGTVALAWRPRTRPAAWQGLVNGAILTGIILAAILAYILIGWDSFFTRFHELLFPPGTWTFDYSTTLIRLFPEKFWFDVGVLIGAGTLVDAALIGVVAHWLGRRAARRSPG